MPGHDFLALLIVCVLEGYFYSLFSSAITASPVRRLSFLLSVPSAPRLIEGKIVAMRHVFRIAIPDNIFHL